MTISPSMRLGTMILLIRNNPGFDSKKTRAGSVPALYYVLNIKKKKNILKKKKIRKSAGALFRKSAVHGTGCEGEREARF